VWQSGLQQSREVVEEFVHAVVRCEERDAELALGTDESLREEYRRAAVLVQERHSGCQVAVSDESGDSVDGFGKLLFLRSSLAMMCGKSLGRHR
jgi:hypothetical protein